MTPPLLPRLVKLSIPVVGICFIWHCHKKETANIEDHRGLNSSVSTVTVPVLGIPSKTIGGDALVSLSEANISNGGVPEDEALPDARLLNGGTQISNEVCDYLGLDKIDSSAVQSAVDQMWNELRIVSKTAVSVDLLRTDPEKEIISLRLQVPVEQGNRILGQFEDEIFRTIGKQKAREVLRHFNWAQYYGAFGRNELFFRYKIRGS
ncbi:MAG: hypothetical protein KDN22_24735 [Verrucomicrobiae bacterium]|nr:hypothetical protein [Verrucomicrobiae bacterium]